MFFFQGKKKHPFDSLGSVYVFQLSNLDGFSEVSKPPRGISSQWDSTADTIRSAEMKQRNESKKEVKGWIK